MLPFLATNYDGLFESLLFIVLFAFAYIAALVAFMKARAENGRGGGKSIAKGALVVTVASGIGLCFITPNFAGVSADGVLVGIGVLLPALITLGIVAGGAIGGR